MKSLRNFLVLSVLYVLSVPSFSQDVTPPIVEKNETIPVKTQVRVHRISIIAEAGTTAIVIERERVRLDVNGAVLGREELPLIRRDLTTVAAESTVIAGKTVTVAQIIAVLAQLAPAWATQDSPP